MKIKDLFCPKRRRDLFLLGERRLAKLEEEGRYSCYRNTRATLRKLARYLRTDHFPVGKMTPELVGGFRNYLLNEVGNHPNTATENLKILSQLIDAAGLRHNPCRAVPKSRVERQRTYLLEEELSRLMALRLKSGSEMEVARDLFFVECRTGLRISDLLQLRWSSYDGVNLHLQMQKTGRLVTVPVTGGVRAVLERYRDLFTQADDFVFPMLHPDDGQGGLFSHAKSLIYATGRVNLQIKRLARKAGIQKKISTHTGRHTFATMLISKGASIYDVKELLGHRDVKVTQVYARLVDRRKQELMELLE